MSHDDIEGHISLHQNPFIVIQWESLHRLRFLWRLADRKLVLLVDEWNSIARQMESIVGAPAEDLFMFQVSNTCIPNSQPPS